MKYKDHLALNLSAEMKTHIRHKNKRNKKQISTYRMQSIHNSLRKKV